MIQLSSKAKIYFLPVYLLVILGSIALLFINTGDSIIFLSNHRTGFWNFFFKYGTQVGEEIAYVIALLILIFIRFGYAIMIPIIGIVVTLVSFTSKLLFSHPRPSIFFREQITEGLINVVPDVHMIGGLTSFPSGHTMSAFCLFGFLALALHKTKGKVIWQFLCVLMAMIVGISRMYLVQHFLKDVVLGALLGSLLAIVFFWVAEHYFQQPWALWKFGKSSAVPLKPRA